MKKLLLLSSLCLALAACGHSTLPSKLEAQIAAGDTVRADGLHNVYLIKGVVITPELLDSGAFVTMDRLPSVDRADSELDVVLLHDTTVATCSKGTIARLFPHAAEFVVDGTNVSAEDFARIPASLLLTVTAEAEGKRLVVVSRDSLNAPNPMREEALDAERDFMIGNASFLKPYDLVISDLSTYPEDFIVNEDGYLRSHALLANHGKLTEKEGITLSGYGARPVVSVDNGNWFNSEGWIERSVASFPSLRLPDVLASLGGDIVSLVYTGDKIFALPASALLPYAGAVHVRNAAGDEVDRFLLVFRTEPFEGEFSVSEAVVDSMLATKGYPADSIASFEEGPDGALVVKLK